MKMTEVFSNGYKIKAANDTLQKFTKRCRALGDSLTREELRNKFNVTDAEIAEEVKEGMIKYEPSMSYLKRCIGYSLTTAGIKKVFNLINN